MKSHGLIILALLVAAISLPGCSDNPPQILESEWRMTLLYNRVLGTGYQKLSVFVRADDKDGTEDLAAIHVVNDEAELYWTIPQESWESAQQRGNNWVGSNSIVMQDNTPFPVGSYRVLLTDKSGKSVETSFYLKRQNTETNSARLPSVNAGDGKISISGDIQSPELWIYDTNDQFLFSIQASQLSVEVQSITGKNKDLESGFSYYISGKDRDGYYHLTVGPYYYSP
ncbi:MAG: hypothetical protein EHM28_10190 [Spirochaetaceae bacterium]|nr:MAG: hypothetical protein EHM28_10190 [Spirochaetaceae bacterium]